MTTTVELTPEQVTAVASQLTPDVRARLFYDGERLHVPDDAAELVTAADPSVTVTPVPQEVTQLQIRRALRIADLKEALDEAVATLPEEDQEAWEWASVIRRDAPAVARAAEAMGKTPAEVDDLFRLAAQQSA